MLRDWSAARSIDGDYTNIEEFFSDASHTAGHSCDVSTPSSTSRATTETVLLLSIALKDPEKNCSLVHSTVLVSGSVTTGRKHPVESCHQDLLCFVVSSCWRFAS